MRKLLASCSLLILAFGGASIARADSCSALSSNLVANCGFETGSFSSWTGSSTMDTTGNYNGVDGNDPYQGTYEAYLGAFNTPTTLSQTLNTVAGHQYTISFALDNTFDGSSSYPNSFAADFGNSVLFSVSNAPASAYSLLSFTGIATGTSTTLSFVTMNDAGVFDLDDVSVLPAAVSATPEPSSLLLMGSGLVGALGMARRRLRA